jgi:NitT/TauT family transport system substrate-binding protein
MPRLDAAAGRLVVTLALLLAVAVPSPGAGKDLQFVLDFMPDGFHAPFYAALEQGFYKDEGLNVRISRGYGSGDTVRRSRPGSSTSASPTCRRSSRRAPTRTPTSRPSCST